MYEYPTPTSTITTRYYLNLKAITRTIMYDALCILL
jgi:hypothetical protein